MKLNQVLNWKNLFSKKEDEPDQRKEQLITSFIRTHAFSKLTVQNKILSLGKLIMIFRADCGFTPASLERTLRSLQAELDRQTNSSWQALYSDVNFKAAMKK